MIFKANLFLILTVFNFLFFSNMGISSQDLPYGYQSQDPITSSIIEKEKSIKHLKNIINIINRIDATYGDLLAKLKNGKKITIFFDPAHGKLSNGKWEGEISGRISCKGLPEEYYSIQFSRKIFELLSENKYINIKSTDDFMYALMGDSDVYSNIPFTETIKMAKASGAFIIISEHLNNISSINKADGLVNLKGIHITYDGSGNKHLTFINGVHKGFLTLYNKFDPTGFSKSIANKIKISLSSIGIEPNNWEYGAVADDRFSYFVDFPISIIFENGFISNPAEEVRLSDPVYQQTLVKAQYNALIDSINDIFGIDISGFWLSGNSDKSKKRLILLKLSRIAIYYLKNNDPGKAISVINKIENNFNNLNNAVIEPYARIKKRIKKAEKHYKKYMRLSRGRKYKKAKRNLIRAIKIVGSEPIFQALNKKYRKKAYRDFKIKYLKGEKKSAPEKIYEPYFARRSSRNTPIIFVVDNDKNIEEAVRKALSPDEVILKKLVKSFTDAYVLKKVKVKKYNRKKKRKIYYWKWKKSKVTFKEGIYIVKINKKFEVKQAKRVSRILLNPLKYQNHQYLKNSYFASNKKQKFL